MIRDATQEATGEVERVVTRWSSSDDALSSTVENPATGRPIAIVEGCGPEEVDRAVRAAHEAHFTWRERAPRERGKVLLRAASLIRDHADDLARLECREMGKPVSQARNVDVEQCITIFEYYAGLVEMLPSQVRELGYAVDITLLEPFGVVAGIVPFNWPPLHIAGKAGPALAVGNGVVLKPSENAPLTLIRIAEMVQSVLPDDVLHVVPGGDATGKALVAHPVVGKIAFTGSSDAGRHVAHAAADRLVSSLLELGGKNPLLIFEDADLSAAVVGAVEGGFFNQGEACTASSRVLVHHSLHDEFLERFCPAVERLRVGDGFDPGTHVGPLITAEQRQRVLDYIEIGLDEGARIVAQGALPTDDELRGGYFVAPTVFADVTEEMRIANEEIFGPVVSVIPFDDEDHAVRMANGTEFGLIAGVYSSDGERLMRVCRRIDASIVFANNFNRSFVGTPFGGTHASGYGRVHSPETLYEFGWSKSIRLPSGIGEIPRWSAVDDVLGPA